MKGDLQKVLHERYNRRDDWISPVRIKGFRREHLAQTFAEFDMTFGAEVGVAEGKFSEVLLASNPNLRLICADAWAPYFSQQRKIKDDVMQEYAWNEAHKRLEPFEERVTWMRMPSDEAAGHIPDCSLDFVYIDADHTFDFVMLDLIYWSRKVRPGGIISGHDYYRFRGAGVVPAVDAFTHAHRITEWYVCDEREVSFFWVKP